MFGSTLTASPFRTFTPFATELDGLIEAFGSAAAGPGFPAVNVFESENALVVEAELPGFALGNVEVTFVGRDLTIQGERPVATPEGAKAIHRERRAHRFTRTLRIGVPVDGERVTAALKNGVLTVTLPKAAAAQARKVTVEGSAH